MRNSLEDFPLFVFAGNIIFSNDIANFFRCVCPDQTPVPFDGSASFHFYVYPNEAPAKLADATSIVIAGKYNGKRTYYRIDVNVKKDNNDISYGEGTAAHQYVKSNTIYSIKATVKGEGTDKPTEEPINISFWVQAADWNYVEQSEEF